jgi:predicted transcriptional regulator
MLFMYRFHPALRAGSITLTFRRWAKPHVRVGGRYRFGPDDVLVADSLAQVRAGAIADTDARRSGFDSADTLRAELGVAKSAKVYRVEFHYERAKDERTQAALNAKLSAADVEQLSKTLERMGAWALETLRLIEKQPHVAASKLAPQLGRERDAFKIDVRKLKRLGLTISHDVGYEISPRGRMYLREDPRFNR